MKALLLVLFTLALMLAFVPRPHQKEKFRSGHCDAASIRKAQLPVSDFHVEFSKQTKDFRLAI